VNQEKREENPQWISTRNFGDSRTCCELSVTKYSKASFRRGLQYLEGEKKEIETCNSDRGLAV
jgi:hypothetical protein